METELIKRSVPSSRGKSFLSFELNSWKRLFADKYVKRTMIGIMIMFFQRRSRPEDFSICDTEVPSLYITRMERDQCTFVLWTAVDEKDWLTRRYGRAPWVRSNWNSPIHCRHPSNLKH